MSVLGRIGVRVAAAVVAACSLGVSPIATAVESSSGGGCALTHMLPGDARTASCMACHAAGSGSGHPVDVDYARLAAGRSGGMGLRPVEEVVRRGVYLADGKIDCLTCHDPRSPYANHIALPPGSKPSPAVHPRKRETYDEEWRAQREAEFRLALQRGDRVEVTAKPLCLACHKAD